MNVDLNNLPDDVIFYSHDTFYNFIKSSLGVDELKLIQVQSIKNVRTLIRVPDVLAVFNFKSKELIDLKNRMCLIDEDDNNNYIVKPGIETSIDDLITVLKAKNNKYIKGIKNSKSSSLLLLAANGVHSDTSLSNISNLDSVDSQLTPAPPTTPLLLSVNEYICLISDSIEKFSINTFKNIILTNNNDYEICLSVLSREINGYIKCGCNTKIKIGFRSKSNSFQLSAYLKHLKQSRCCMIKKKQQSLSKISSITNYSSPVLLQDEDCNSLDDDNDGDEENLNNEKNSSQMVINRSATSTSNYSKNKRSSSSSTASTTKKKKS